MQQKRTREAVEASFDIRERYYDLFYNNTLHKSVVDVIREMGLDAFTDEAIVKIAQSQKEQYMTNNS